jgi:hypothetical protein
MGSNSLFESVARTRAAISCVITGSLGLVALYETYHLVAQHADVFALVLVGGITVWLAFQTRRSYRRFRGQKPNAAREEPPPSTPRAPTA